MRLQPSLSAIGASYAGALAITTTSGPGMALKTEALGLAVAIELPLVICNIQRGGPSTGLPTKTEQADLLQALYRSKFRSARFPFSRPPRPAIVSGLRVEACRIAVKYMVPVILLSDGYLANGAEPWLVPELSEIPDFKVEFAKTMEGFSAVQTRSRKLWRAPGPYPARPDSSIASAASKSRTSPATSITSR